MYVWYGAVHSSLHPGSPTWSCYPRPPPRSRTDPSTPTSQVPKYESLNLPCQICFLWAVYVWYGAVSSCPHPGSPTWSCYPRPPPRSRTEPSTPTSQVPKYESLNLPCQICFLWAVYVWYGAVYSCQHPGSPTWSCYPRPPPRSRTEPSTPTSQAPKYESLNLPCQICFLWAVYVWYGAVSSCPHPGSPTWSCYPRPPPRSRTDPSTPTSQVPKYESLNLPCQICFLWAVYVWYGAVSSCPHPGSPTWSCYPHPPPHSNTGPTPHLGGAGSKGRRAYGLLESPVKEIL